MTDNDEMTNNLDEFEDIIDDDDKPDDIPKEERKLTTQAYDKSVSDVVRMMSNGDIHLNPEYQRQYVWDSKKASLLIESILLNVPIPVIYVAQEEDDSWSVIDGLQRLYSLKRFFDRDFKLTGLELLQELSRCDIKSLNPKAARMLKNGLLRIIVISYDSHPEIKYDIFMRLNRGAVKLNEQELRNCLFRGELNRKIMDLRKYEKYQLLLKIKKPHKRLLDVELLLRFIAINENWDPTNGEIKNYKGKVKSFLNYYMEESKNISVEKLQCLVTKFQVTVDKVVEVLGENAFRRNNKEGGYERPLNRALMDCILNAFEKFDHHSLVQKKSEIATALKELVLNNEEFRNSITKATSDKKVIEFRLRSWYTKLLSVME